MSFKYTVTEYYFREPKVITEFEYDNLKTQSLQNPNFSLIDKEETLQNNY